MPSELFDPLLQITLTVAKRDTKAKPPVSVPARVVPMLTFTKVPEKAKDALLEVLTPAQVLRLLHLREQLGQRIRRLRGQPGRGDARGGGDWLPGGGPRPFGSGQALGRPHRS